MDAERKELLLDTLRKKLPRGTTVYTVRKGDKWFYVLLCAYEGKVHNITRDALQAVGRAPAEWWHVPGQGFNHARSAVEELSMTLYGDVRALGWEGNSPA